MGDRASGGGEPLACHLLHDADGLEREGRRGGAAGRQIERAARGAEQAPAHPVNVEPVAGLAVSVTSGPSANGCEQTEPQSIPSGLDVTVPSPLPEPVTVSAFAQPTPPTVTATLRTHPVGRDAQCDGP